MTDRLNEIAERVAKASPGPWEFDIKGWITPSRQLEVFYVCADNSHSVKVVDSLREEDGDFIAHARQDIPWLLEQVAALTAEKAKAGPWYPWDNQARKRMADLEAENKDASVRVFNLLGAWRPIGWVDYACSQCVPHGDSLVPGFVCTYHEFKALATEPTPPAQSNPEKEGA